jgi:hypothetical protein
MQGHGQREHPRAAQHHTPYPALQADQQVGQVYEHALMDGVPAFLVAPSRVRPHIIQGPARQTVLMCHRVRELLQLDAQGGCPHAQPGPRLVTVVASPGPGFFPKQRGFLLGAPERVLHANALARPDRVLHANKDMPVCACRKPQRNEVPRVCLPFGFSSG